MLILMSRFRFALILWLSVVRLLMILLRILLVLMRLVLMVLLLRMCRRYVNCLLNLVHVRKLLDAVLWYWMVS